MSIRDRLALDLLIVRHRSTDFPWNFHGFLTDPGVLFLHVPRGVGPNYFSSGETPEKNSTAKVHLKYVKCWGVPVGVQIKNTRILILFADALLAFVQYILSICYKQPVSIYLKKRNNVGKTAEYPPWWP